MLGSQECIARSVQRLGEAAVMYLEVLIGAVAKEPRATRPEVGKPGDVLLRCQGGCLVEMISVCLIIAEKKPK
jgi:hypothetical protein